MRFGATARRLAPVWALWLTCAALTACADVRQVLYPADTTNASDTSSDDGSDTGFSSDSDPDQTTDLGADTSQDLAFTDSADGGGLDSDDDVATADLTRDVDDDGSLVGEPCLALALSGVCDTVCGESENAQPSSDCGAISCCLSDDTVSCSVGGVPGACLPTAVCTGDRDSTPGFCPGPADIQCCTAQGQSFECDPDERQFPDPIRSEADGDLGCPDGMARIDDFCIDRYEASLVDETEASDQPFSPYHNPGDTAVRALSIGGAVPQGYITGEQAAAACDAGGKRLCDDDEWLRACRGPDNFTYPYGDLREWDRCNDRRAIHPVVELFGTSADWIWSQLGNACISQLPDSLHRTGANEGCESAEGVFDLVGNLHEWTSNSTGVFRGGFYVDTYRNGNGCLYATTAHNIFHWDYSTGFRCCSDAD